jgi:hypothetical protein
VELPGFVRDAPTLWCGTAAATAADSGAEPALGKGAIVQVRAGCRVECVGLSVAGSTGGVRCLFEAVAASSA